MVIKFNHCLFEIYQCIFDYWIQHNGICIIMTWDYIFFKVILQERRFSSFCLFPLCHVSRKLGFDELFSKSYKTNSATLQREVIWILTNVVSETQPPSCASLSQIIPAPCTETYTQGATLSHHQCRLSQQRTVEH